MVALYASAGLVYAPRDHPQPRAAFGAQNAAVRSGRANSAAQRIPPPVPSVERQPVSQVSGVFNASNQSVLRELKTFANGRTQFDSALMDQKFLVDSDSYMRFVCNAMVRRLMDVERTRASDR